MMNVGLQRVGLSSRGIWGVCLEIVEGPFFLFALSLIAAEGMELGRGEREYTSGTESRIAWARSFLCW